MPRAVSESATANGMTPPAAIRPTGDEISNASFVTTTPSSGLVAASRRLTQLPMLAGIDEGEDFRDRGILSRQIPVRFQTIGEHARAVKQRLIERSYHRKTRAGESAALHPDDVEAGERAVLAAHQGERDHVAAHAGKRPDHHLRAHPAVLMDRRQAANENKIADLAMPAQRRRGREDHVVADDAVVPDMAAIHEIAAVPDAGQAATGHGACAHGRL